MQIEQFVCVCVYSIVLRRNTASRSIGPMCVCEPNCGFRIDRNIALNVTRTDDRFKYPISRRSIELCVCVSDRCSFRRGRRRSEVHCGREKHADASSKRGRRPACGRTRICAADDGLRLDSVSASSCPMGLRSDDNDE